MEVIQKNLQEKLRTLQAGDVDFDGKYQPNYDTTLTIPSIGTEKIETKDIPGVVTGVAGLESEDIFKGGNAKIDPVITDQERAEMTEDIYNSLDKNIKNIVNLSNSNYSELDNLDPNVLVKDFNTSISLLDDALYLYSTVQAADSATIGAAVLTISTDYALKYKDLVYNKIESWVISQKNKLLSKVKSTQIFKVLQKVDEYVGILDTKPSGKVATHLAGLDVSSLSNNMSLMFKEGQMQKSLLKLAEDTIFNSINNSSKLLTTIAPATEGKLETLKTLHQNRDYSGLLNSLSYLQSFDKNSLKPLFLQLVDEAKPYMELNDKVKYANSMVNLISSNSNNTIDKLANGEVGKLFNVAEVLNSQANTNKIILMDNYLR